MGDAHNINILQITHILHFALDKLKDGAAKTGITSLILDTLFRRLTSGAFVPTY
jgi:hypothetical protein